MSLSRPALVLAIALAALVALSASLGASRLRPWDVLLADEGVRAVAGLVLWEIRAPRRPRKSACGSAPGARRMKSDRRSSQSESAASAARPMGTRRMREPLPVTVNSGSPGTSQLDDRWADESKWRISRLTSSDSRSPEE